jgi:hypothetical protein
LVALSLLLSAASARAEDYDQAAKDLARGYAEEGIAQHDHGEYAAAVQNFTKAYRVLEVPTVGIRLARSQAKLGRLIEAEKTYQSVIDAPVKKTDPSVFAQAVLDARAELAELSPRIPTLQINFSPGVTSATLDGSPVAFDMIGTPMPINPGDHHIGGVGALPEVLLIRERDHVSLKLRVSEKEPDDGEVNWRRIAGISTAGLGGVALGVGVATSIKTSLAADSPVHEGQTSIELQFVFYSAALVLGGVGTFLIATSGKSSSPKPVQVRLLPHISPQAGGLNVIGTF